MWAKAFYSFISVYIVPGIPQIKEFTIGATRNISVNPAAKIIKGNLFLFWQHRLYIMQLAPPNVIPPPKTIIN